MTMMMMMMMKPCLVAVVAAVSSLLVEQTAGFAPLSSRTTNHVAFPARSISRSRILLSSSAPPEAPPVSSKDEEDFFVTSPDDKPQPEEESFDWFQQWYPLVPVEILDPEVPHKFQLLGEDLVVWNDGAVGDEEYGSKKKKKSGQQSRNGEWRAFVDECPHRKVPLSEGRVENDGTLLCSYHGWRFEGETGKCVSVPQIMDSPSEHERIVSNPKTSCGAHPTRVVNGVLYVWASRDENAALQASLTPVTSNYKILGQDEVASLSEMEQERVWEGPWNYRELPYGADFFLENVVDPSHVPVSHHNVVGSRYEDLTMHVDSAQSLVKSGFAIAIDTPATVANSTTKFVAPAAVHIEAPIEDAGEGAMQVLELLVSPSRPGFCNHVGRMVIIKGKEADGSVSKKSPAMLRQFTLPLPNWVNHIMASAFLNQDALFLHHQERKMHETGQYSSVGSYYDSNNGKDDKTTSYTKSVYPVRTDKGVLNFRNWLARFTPGRKGKIPYKLHHPIMPPADNSVVFDVWNAHTKHCAYCQGALRRLKTIRFLTIAVSLCCAVLRPFGKLPSLVATLTTAGIGYLLHKLIGMFYKYEFSHAHND